jgi:membrane protein HdeD
VNAVTTRRTTASTSVTDVLLGLLLVAGGLVLLVGTSLKVIPSIVGLSAFVLVAGLAGILGAIIGRTSAGFFTEIVSGAELTVLGLVLLRFPETPAATAQLLAGALFAVNGIVRLASATEFPSLRGIMLVGGAASLALAAAVFTGAVPATVGNLGLLVGVELVVDGVSAVLIGRHEHPNRR